MALVLLVAKRLFSLFHCFTASIRRVLCIFNRTKTHSDDVLPFTVQQANAADPEFEGWDTWERRKPKSESEIRIEEYRKRLVSAKEESLQQSTETNQEENIDYFDSMSPDFKKPKQIVIKTKSNNTDPVSSRDRFAVQNDANLMNTNYTANRLEELDETSYYPSLKAEDTWEVDESSLDVDSVMKEAKHKERQQRLEEQKRKKLERNSVNNKRALEAVKLS